jgi:hypothetical protein
MRIRRIDIDFQIKVEATVERVVTMTLSLSNKSPNSYYINNNALLLNGFKGQTFHIAGPSKILCSFHSGKYEGDGMFLLSNRSDASNTVIISDPCQFQSAIPGVYTVSIRDHTYLYTESNMDSYSNGRLGGNSEEYIWLIGNSSFLIGETKDATISSSLSGTDSL